MSAQVHSICVVWSAWRSCHPHTFKVADSRRIAALSGARKVQSGGRGAVDSASANAGLYTSFSVSPSLQLGAAACGASLEPSEGLLQQKSLLSGPMLWKVSPSVFRCASTACRCALLAYIDVSEYDLFMLCCRFWRATRRSACLQRASRKCATSVCKSLKQLARRAR